MLKPPAPLPGWVKPKQEIDMMTGTKGHSGKGSGGAGRGQGMKRKRIVIERGTTLSISRVKNSGTRVYPAVDGEVIHVGGENGHDLQFVVLTPDETLTIFLIR